MSPSLFLTVKERTMKDMPIFKLIKQRHQEELYLIEAEDWDRAMEEILAGNIEPYARISMGSNDGELNGEEIDEEDAQYLLDLYHLKHKDIQPSL